MLGECRGKGDGHTESHHSHRAEPLSVDVVIKSRANELRKSRAKLPFMYCTTIFTLSYIMAAQTRTLLSTYVWLHQSHNDGALFGLESTRDRSNSLFHSRPCSKTYKQVHSAPCSGLL
jgi:hypothetical protein